MKKVSVFTYVNPQKWEDNPYVYQRIKDGIHITSTRNLAEGIRERYQKKQEDNYAFSYIFSIKEVMTKLLGEWETEEYRLLQYCLLSKVLEEEYVADNNLKESFRRNLWDASNTIQSLVKSGIQPDDLRDVCKSEKEKLFFRVWKKAEARNSSYSDIRNFLNGKRGVRCILSDIVGSHHFLNGNIPPIVLHGFYYITPEQQTILKLLKNTGFEIIFFLHYDKRFPSTFEFMRKFISDEFDWSKYWEIEEYKGRNENGTTGIGEAFLNCFEHYNTVSYVSNKRVNLYRYEDFLSFLQRVIIPEFPLASGGKENEKCTLIATNADILNNILLQYYPHIYGNTRNFLSYPVGRFILNLHQMIENDKLVLDRNILMCAFSSGWLYTEEDNARNYTYQLQCILPFFEKCKEIDEWKQQLEILLNQYDVKSDFLVNNFPKEMFNKISQLSLERYELERIRGFILQLEGMVKNIFLFNKSRDIDLKNHFSRLLKCLFDREGKIAEWNEQEERIVKELKIKINLVINSKTSSEKILYKDINEAINLYLSGRFKDEDGIIKPFIEVDGEVFKKHNKIYLTGLDENGLPLGQFKIPWPFQENTYKELSKKLIVLRLNLLRNESIEYISRYLLFLALEYLPLKSMELSWIVSFLDRQNLHKSVYMNILKKEGVLLEQGVSIENQLSRIEDEDCVESSGEYLDKLGEYELAEYQQCPKRFYYNYLLNKNYSFKDKLNQKFIFSQLVQIYYVKWKMENRNCEIKDSQKSDLIKEVGNLFPQLSEMEKQSEGRGGFSKSFTHKNRKASFKYIKKVTRSIILPGIKREEREAFFEAQEETTNKIRQSIESSNFEYGDIKYCKFCPNIDYCPRGFIEKE